MILSSGIPSSIRTCLMAKASVLPTPAGSPPETINATTFPSSSNFFAPFARETSTWDGVPSGFIAWPQTRATPCSAPSTIEVVHGANLASLPQSGMLITSAGLPRTGIGPPEPPPATAQTATTKRTASALTAGRRQRDRGQGAATASGSPSEADSVGTACANGICMAPGARAVSRAAALVARDDDERSRARAAAGETWSRA
mmetsp:Transcript_52274/g.139228  ORF Transcript_52274/g.139228 Transcript_52274/m.139228 type:complete len:201 (-) Transcript_52274:31-633(-)